MKHDQSSNNGVVNVDAHYLSHAEGTSEAFQCQVVKEAALLLQVEDIGHYTLMWTPTTQHSSAWGFTPEDGVLGDEAQPEALCLAIGFALSEGLIERLADVSSVALCPDDPAVVRMKLKRADPQRVTRKNIVVNSSCGICGPREILEDNALQLAQVADTLRIKHGLFPALTSRMKQGQNVFQQTGGSHAAAIFDPSGTILALAEDLGRHNAMDKVIGMVLVQRGSLAGCGIVLSSRLSLELVLKAVRTGLQMMLAISAPTSLAIEVADKFGVTLCGFVRKQRATVYTHPQRVLGAHDLQL